MDQDSFRRLMKGSKPNGSCSSTLGISSSSRAKLVVPSARQKVATPQPSFKPRNVKESKDRGRKPGTIKASVDDSDRIETSGPPPNKGLDFALLEQEKAKAAQLTHDDVDELEQAFAESSAKSAEQIVPKKRTREEIIRELKRKRAEEGGQTTPSGDLEEVKQKGKFKPIGFKPIGSSLAGNKRKESGEGESIKKKKKRKAEGAKNGAPSTNEPAPAPPMMLSFEPSKPPDDDFDIFADAGDYTGIEIDDEEVEEPDEETAGKSPAHDTVAEAAESTSMPLGRWIAMDDEPAQVLPSRLPLPTQPTPGGSKVETEDLAEEELMRLAPLESSAVPSIKDLLAMDEAAIKYEKKQKRKERKRKQGGNVGSDDD